MANQPQNPAPQQGQQGQHTFGDPRHQKLHQEAKKYGITVPDWLQSLINDYGDDVATFMGTMILRILASLKTQNQKAGFNANAGQGKSCPQQLKQHLEAAHDYALAAAIETACACCDAECDCPDCDDDPCKG